MTFKNPWDALSDKISNENSDRTFFKDIKKPRGGKNDNNKDFNFNDLLNKNIILMGLVTALVIWLSTGFYVIKQEETGIILRFGKFVRTVSPGLHYKLPFPIETVIKEATTRIRVLRIGADGNRDSGQKMNDNLILTGDENMVDIVFEVQWRIKNLSDFVFQIKDKQSTIANAAISVIREVVSKQKLTAILTSGRSVIEEESKKSLQEILDSYHSGIEIILVQMLKVDPPVEVIDSFQDVQTARIDKESEINKAYFYENNIIPSARGRAGRIIQDAESYRIKTINDALGNSERFNKVYEQYKLSPYITRKRMYLDAMENVLNNNSLSIVDSSLKSVIVNMQKENNLSKTDNNQKRAEEVSDPLQTSVMAVSSNDSK